MDFFRESGNRVKSGVALVQAKRKYGGSASPDVVAEDCARAEVL